MRCCICCILHGDTFMYIFLVYFVIFHIFRFVYFLTFWSRAGLGGAIKMYFVPKQLKGIELSQQLGSVQ